MRRVLTALALLGIIGICGAILASPDTSYSRPNATGIVHEDMPAIPLDSVARKSSFKPRVYECVGVAFVDSTRWYLVRTTVEAYTPSGALALAMYLNVAAHRAAKEMRARQRTYPGGAKDEDLVWRFSTNPRLASKDHRI